MGTTPGIRKALVETGLNGTRPHMIRLAGMSHHEPHRSGSRRNRNGHPSSRPLPMPLSEILARGPVAGAIGVTVLALAEKLGQAFTKRPNSYVPAHILERLLGLSHRADHERLLLNSPMHRASLVYPGTRKRSHDRRRSLWCLHGVSDPAMADLKL